MFGCFLKYIVTEIDESLTHTAFTTGQLPSLTPPTRIVNNKKDKLYNDIILLLDGHTMIYAVVQICEFID